MPSLERAFIEDRILFWHGAVELQRERIAAHDFRTWIGRLEVDGAFFAMALRNTVRAVRMARDQLREIKSVVDPALDRFEANVPDWKNVRDVAEHFDEYMFGKGRLQADGVRTDPAYLTRAAPGELLLTIGELELDVGTAVRELDTLVELTVSSASNAREARYRPAASP